MVTAFIADYQLPDGTGLDVLAAAHTRKPTMQVVIMSTDTTRRGASLAADAVVPKLFDMPALLRGLLQLAEPSE